MSKSITKSIRLTAAESAELKRLSQASALSESALMKQWVIDGIQAQKLALALQAYQRPEVDLREGAARAGVTINRFMAEVEAHHIVMLDDPAFLDSLAALGETFGNPNLESAARSEQAR